MHMTWNRYGRGGGWEKFAETMAMMAMNGNMNFAGPGFKARARWDEEGPRGPEGEGAEEARGRRGRRGRRK